jgi:hypothetical protein
MTRQMMGTLGLALLFATPAAAAPGGLDAQAVKAARSFLGGLATDLQAAAAGADGAREQLLSRGRLEDALGRELDQLVKLTREAGGLTSVRFNTFALHATVWFGVVPLKEVELHMLMAPDRMRLLRTVVRDTRLRVFGRPPATTWTGDGAKAFGALANQMVRAMTDGDCKALPRIRPADHKAFMPTKRKARKNTLSVFERFGKMIDQGCEALDKVPHHVTTWRFGEVGGTVTTEGASSVAFKMSLSHDAEGAPQIFHLRAIPPAKRSTP